MSPTFSIIVPVYRPKRSHFEACLESVLNQTFGDWELCLALDGPQPDHIEDLIGKAGAAADDKRRVKVHRREAQGGISAASNDALALAAGDFIVLLDNDDALSDRALEVMAGQLQQHPDVDIAYSDWFLTSDTGDLEGAFHKPAWSPERLRVQMYLIHLLVMRRSIVEDVGGFRSEFDGAQDHDLVLRVSERARSIVHVPRGLYYWRQAETSTASDAGAKPWAFTAGVNSVQAHLDRTSFPATASIDPRDNTLIALTPDLPAQPLVSVIIPTAGASKTLLGVETVLVDSAVRTLLQVTDYDNIEVIVILDRTSPDSLSHDLLAIDEQVTTITNERPFNFAEACNLGAANSSGEVLVFLNDDIEVTEAAWLQHLVMYATQPEVGAVGLKLLYADRTVQHGGVTARYGTPANLYMGYRSEHPGNFQALRIPQNVLAVTGACLAVERRKFETAGGFCIEFPLSYNDVDLCLKLTRLGWRCVVDCSVSLVHHESASRDPTVADWEFERLADRWGSCLHDVPYDNPNFRAPDGDTFPSTAPYFLEIQERVFNGRYPARVWPFT